MHQQVYLESTLILGFKNIIIKIDSSMLEASNSHIISSEGAVLLTYGRNVQMSQNLNIRYRFNFVILH